MSAKANIAAALLAIPATVLLFLIGWGIQLVLTVPYAVSVVFWVLAVLAAASCPVFLIVGCVRLLLKRPATQAQPA
jgi:hypothetical protein